MNLRLPHDDPDYKFVQRKPHTACHRIAERSTHPVTRARTYRTVCGQVLFVPRDECYLLKKLDHDKECSYCAAKKPSPGSRPKVRK